MTLEHEWEERLLTTSKDLPGLNALDDLCRCRICKEYLNGPMMATCGHTFCSLCIRRTLNADGRCPACRSLEEENKLRKNLLTEELVDAFLSLREPLLHKLLAMENTRGSNGEAQSHEQDEGSQQTIVTTDSTLRRSNRRLRSSQTIEIPDEAPPKGHVICPVCSRYRHIDKINAHVDRCLGGRSSPPHSSEHSSPGPSKSRHFTDSPPRITGSEKVVASKEQKRKDDTSQIKRLPKPNYAVMTDTQLRKNMAELGISTSGNRALLQKRYTEYIALWNSNLDAKNPSNKRELIKQLEHWDRTQVKQPTKITNDDIDSAHKNGDFDGAFKDLVAQARQSMKRKADQEKPAVESKRQSLQDQSQAP